MGRLANSRIDDGEVRGGGETGLRAHNRSHTREGIRHGQCLQIELTTYKFDDTLQTRRVNGRPP